MAYYKPPKYPHQTKRGVHQVGAVLGELLQNGDFRGGISRARVLAAWRTVAGQPLSGTTRAVRLADGIMTIETQDAIAANMLTFQRQAYLDKLQALLGPLAPRELRFQAGVWARVAEQAPPARDLAAPLPEAEARQVAALVAGAAPELAQATQNAATALARMRLARLAQGWLACPICQALKPEAGLCPSCRLLRASPRLQQASLLLARNPGQLPGHLIEGEVEEALARAMALEYLGERLEAALLEMMTEPEMQPMLEFMAEQWLVLKLQKPANTLARSDWRALPERVWSALGR
jgi:hypothetical protein